MLQKMIVFIIKFILQGRERESARILLPTVQTPRGGLTRWTDRFYWRRLHDECTDGCNERNWGRREPHCLQQARKVSLHVTSPDLFSVGCIRKFSQIFGPSSRISPTFLTVSNRICTFHGKLCAKVLRIERGYLLRLRSNGNGVSKNTALT